MPAGDCTAVPKIGEPKCKLRFPGGIQVPPIAVAFPSNIDSALAGLQGLSLGLAPFKPFFDLLDLVMQLVKCVKAVPDAITSLNPADLIKCVPDLLLKLDVVIQLIPPVSMLPPLKDLLCLIYQLLKAIAELLAAIADALRRLKIAWQAGLDLDDSTLTRYATCGQTVTEAQTSALGQKLKEVQQVLDIFNLFAGLVGLPEVALPIPSFLISGQVDASVEVEEIDAAAADLNQIAEVIKTIHDAIPG